MYRALPLVALISLAVAQVYVGAPGSDVGQFNRPADVTELYSAEWMVGKYVARMEVNGKVHYYSSRTGAIDEVVFNGGAFEAHNNITAGLSSCTTCFATDDESWIESSADHSLLVWKAGDEINVGSFSGSTMDVVQTMDWPGAVSCGMGSSDTELMITCVAPTGQYWTTVNLATPATATIGTIDNTRVPAYALTGATSTHTDGENTILCFSNMPSTPAETGAIILNSTDTVFMHSQVDEATYGEAPICEIFAGGYSASGKSLSMMMMGGEERGNLVLYDTTTDEVVRNHFYQDGLSIIMMESQNWYGSEGLGRIRSAVVPGSVLSGEQVTVHVTAGGNPDDDDHGRFAVNYKIGTGPNSNWNFPALIQSMDWPEITDVDLDVQPETDGENPIVMTIKMPGQLMTTHLVVYQRDTSGTDGVSGSADEGNSPLSGATFLIIGGVLVSLVIILVFWGILKPTSDGAAAYKAADSSNDSKA